jgi:hypothetical protein
MLFLSIGGRARRVGTRRGPSSLGTGSFGWKVLGFSLMGISEGFAYTLSALGKLP